MSSGSISDAGEVGEGEGPKVVQSSFKEASIMNKSIAVKDPTPVEEQKQEVQPEPPEAPKEVKQEIKQEIKQEENKIIKPQKAFKKILKKPCDSFNFEITKMKGTPILNKDTVNPNTFDIDFLLNPEVQKLAHNRNKLKESSTVKNSNKPQVNPTNHIQKNIKNSKILSNSKSSKELPPSDVPEIQQKAMKIDVEERFYKKAQIIKDKIQVLKEQKAQGEIIECTFKPQIKTKRENKSYDEFYEYMKSYAQKKENKIKNIKDEETKAQENSIEYTYQPKLCEKSLQMIAKKSDLEESTFDRLHKLYKNQLVKSSNNSARESFVSDIKNDDSTSFQPTVNKKSQNLIRTEPVETKLYNDALRRINQDRNPPIPTQHKFITNRSEKVLIDKLKRDFEEAFVRIDSDALNELNYTKMHELFKSMNFIKDENKKEDERLLLLDSWKILLSQGDTYCQKPSILVFLIAIMGFYEDWMEVPDGNRLVLTNYEAHKLHTKFNLFYTNRVSIINKNTTNKEYKVNYEYSFHPQTIIESEILAKNWRSQHRGGGKIEDLLIAEKAKTQKKLEEKRQLMEEQELDECSFQPMIEQMPEEWRVYGIYDKGDLTSEYFKMMNDPKFQNAHKGVVLHDLAKIINQKKEEKNNDLHRMMQEKEIENCTFNPKLEERILPSSYVSTEIKHKKSNSLQIKNINTRKKMNNDVINQQRKNKNWEKDDDNESGIKKNKWPVLESNNGDIAVFSVVLPKSTERLEFNIKSDDPALKVMEFSRVHELKKGEEYQLVKELTILKTL
ncbi:hypothetical protein SteCoe_1825 [Stentor coeruleus]|uniref:EF-hand domain-containing protein n=1 Tax=Stentor coeruleus TaxID=5963 RepID=A0A1R2D135_9CILI|nr:hypothetical protein SteCoe_1825 [Stentor coeruleus]